MSLADDLQALAAPPPHLTPAVEAPAGAGSDGGGWKITVTSTGAEVETDKTEQVIVAADDWDGVLRHFGLNPAEFTIVDDTVRMSSWQQSKRLESGERDTITLYSYRARFARIANQLPASDVAEVARRVHKWKPTARRTPGRGLGVPSTLYVGWADWQLGKSGGGGVEETTERVLDSIEQTVARLKALRRLGRNINAISVWNMGDPNEGCDGNYASQLFTVELTRRQQLGLALDLWLTGVKTFAALVDDLEFGSVLCNHGEWTRQGPGTKAVTSDSDNIGGYLADTLRTVLADRPDFDHVRYTIPHDDMTMLTHMSGVPVALAHGHKAPGSAKELDWLRGQSIRLLHETKVMPRLWMTAHRHHLEIKDYGPWHRIQHPSLDSRPGSTDGSKWFTDTNGHWSTPGTFTCLVGNHDQAGTRGFSDPEVLTPPAE